jgi:hypothetical protein
VLPRPRIVLLLAVLAAACSAAPEPLPPPVPLPPPAPTAAPLRSPDWSTLQAEVETRTIDLRLTPGRDDTGEVDHVNVRIGFSERPGELGDPSPFVLQLAQAEGGETLWPDHIEDLYARDGEGALTLRRSDTAATGTWATWRSDRRPVGPIHVDYRVKIVRGGSERIHGTRADAGGFEGTGATLLLLPDAAGTFTARLAWDLAGAGEGAAAVSSLGPGAAVETTIAGLREAVFMAGPIGQIAADDRGAHLTGAWLGRARFDPLEAIPWVMRARAALRGFFHDGEAGAFSFFVRVVPRRSSGTWDLGSRAAGLLFLPSDDLYFTREVRFAIAAELLRRDLGGTGAPPPLVDGIALHCTRDLLLRAGLATPAELADDLRAHGQDRGMLYAAELDAAVRARNGGRRSLDDLVRALVERARAGALPAGAWREIVGAELGPEGQARYDAVIVRGEPAAPPADAYGPCFRGVKGKGKTPALTWTRDPKVPDAACARPVTP